MTTDVESAESRRGRGVWREGERGGGERLGDYDAEPMSEVKEAKLGERERVSESLGRFSTAVQQSKSL